SGMFGAAGQADYALANGLCAAWGEALSRRISNARVILVDWPGWEGVGMAARGASQFALTRAGHRLMSIAEGLRALSMILNSPSAASRRDDRSSWEHYVLVRGAEIPADMRVTGG